jgi:hypothetical protein
MALVREGNLASIEGRRHVLTRSIHQAMHATVLWWVAVLSNTHLSSISQQIIVTLAECVALCLFCSSIPPRSNRGNKLNLQDRGKKPVHQLHAPGARQCPTRRCEWVFPHERADPFRRDAGRIWISLLQEGNLACIEGRRHALTRGIHQAMHATAPWWVAP